MIFKVIGQGHRVKFLGEGTCTLCVALVDLDTKLKDTKLKCPAEGQKQKFCTEIRLLRSTVKYLEKRLASMFCSSTIRFEHIFFINKQFRTCANAFPNGLTVRSYHGILRGSTLNSLLDVRKSNSDVFPSL